MEYQPRETNFVWGDEERLFHEKLDSIFNKAHVCYFENKGILSKNAMTGWKDLYTVFVGKEFRRDHDPEIAKFNILFGLRRSFKKNDNAPRGYIFARLGDIANSFSKSEAANTIYGAYSLEENKIVFKPLTWMISYWHKTKESTMDSRRRPSGTEFAIRVDPKPPEQERKRDYEFEPCAMSARKPYNGFYTFHVTQKRDFYIEHKEPLIISEQEMFKFLKEHNYYPEGWKLQFKVATNLLTQGELI